MKKRKLLSSKAVHQAELLPGLQVAAEYAVEKLNGCRASLGLSPLKLESVITQPVHRQMRPATASRISRAIRKTNQVKRDVAAENKQIVIEAGIKIKGAEPTATEVRKARQTIARKAKFKGEFRPA